MIYLPKIDDPLYYSVGTSTKEYHADGLVALIAPKLGIFEKN